MNWAGLPPTSGVALCQLGLADISLKDFKLAGGLTKGGEREGWREGVGDLGSTGDLEG